MDPARFDRLTRRLATSRQTRRATLGGAAAGLAALAAGQYQSSAQGTPASEDAMAADNATLFVQTAAGGTFLPNTLATPDGATHGTHRLTLSGHPGQTIGFSDRPQRNFGQLPTSTFFDALGFTPDNPPNAALVISTPAGEDDILVVELLNPTYDADAQILIYEANILSEYAGENLAPVADRQQDQELAAEFDHASLFIDDCPDAVYCFGACGTGGHGGCSPVGPIPDGPYGTCWSWDYWKCFPCSSSWEDLNAKCQAAYNRDQCPDQCIAGS